MSTWATPPALAEAIAMWERIRDRDRQGPTAASATTPAPRRGRIRRVLAGQMELPLWGD